MIFLQQSNCSLTKFNLIIKLTWNQIKFDLQIKWKPTIIVLKSSSAKKRRKQSEIVFSSWHLSDIDLSKHVQGQIGFFEKVDFFSSYDWNNVIMLKWNKVKCLSDQLLGLTKGRLPIWGGQLQSTLKYKNSFTSYFGSKS